jgi:hypothetical protein
MFEEFEGFEGLKVFSALWGQVSKKLPQNFEKIVGGAVSLLTEGVF